MPTSEATSDVERLLDEWAIAWLSSANSDPEWVLAQFIDDGLYEDVTSGAVVRGQEGPRRYLFGADTTIPDFTFGMLRRCAAGPWATIEWTMSGTPAGDWARMPAIGRHFASVRSTSILELEAGRSAASLIIGMQRRS